MKKKKNEKRTSWWVQSKDKQTRLGIDPAGSTNTKKGGVTMAHTKKSGMGFIKPDMRSENGGYLIPESYYNSRMDDIAKFENEYYLSPYGDAIDGLHKKVEGLKKTLKKSKEDYAVLKTSCYILEQSLGSAEARNKSAEKVADWAVKKLLIESIEKSNKIEQLEKKVKEFILTKEKSHVADRLLGIIDKKDHMIHYLMERLEK